MVKIPSIPERPKMFPCEIKLDALPRNLRKANKHICMQRPIKRLVIKVVSDAPTITSCQPYRLIGVQGEPGQRNYATGRINSV